tara:strand:+ start:601 stop:1191 length:591 start_codon:yes stop_codon:yes gene_type:complete
MSVFYFTDPLVVDASGAPIIYELSCTRDITITSPARVTSSAVEDGSSIVDNFYLDNRTVTFNGVITNIRLSGSSEVVLVDQWISSIQQLRKSKKRVTVTSHTEVVPNTIITEFTLTKDKNQGLSGWNCSMTFKEVDISERVRLVEVKEPRVEVKDKTESKANGSSSSTKQVLSTSLDVSLADVVGLSPVSPPDTGV